MCTEAKHSSSQSYFSFGNTPDTVICSGKQHGTSQSTCLLYNTRWHGHLFSLQAVNTAKDTFANGVRMYTSHRRKYVRHLISENK